MSRTHGGAAEPNPKAERIIEGAQRRIGVAIRKRRRKLDLTQESLAEMVGCTPRYLQRVERGECNLTLRILGHLAAALDVDIADLLMS